jgi:hypothetical protein
MVSQIIHYNFKIKNLKVDEGELLYEGKKFVIITDMIPIYYNDEFKTINVYDEKLIDLFKQIEKVTKVTKKIVNSYMNKKQEKKQSIRLKLYKFMDEKEKKVLNDTKGNKFMLMIDLDRIVEYKGDKCIFPFVVHIKPQKAQKVVKHEYDNFMFEDEKEDADL